MTYGQMEKLLIKAVLEPGFREELVALGKAAGARYLCIPEEAEALLALLAHDGAGLAAVLSVIESAIDLRVSLGLYGKLPHEIDGGHPGQHRSGAHIAAMNAHAG